MTSKKNKDSEQCSALAIEVLFTITTDLGDSFYHHDISLLFKLEFEDEHARSANGNNPAETAAAAINEQTGGNGSGLKVMERQVEWRGGSRDHRVSFDLPHGWNGKRASYTLCITASSKSHPRVTEEGRMIMPSILGSEIRHDASAQNDDEDNPSFLRRIPYVSASATAKGEEGHDLLIREAPPNANTSIASHVWDAGVATAAFLPRFLGLEQSTSRTKAGSSLSLLAETIQSKLRRDLETPKTLTVLELGCGCAPLSVSLTTTLLPLLTHSLSNFHLDITLTDLPEAEDMALSNINHMPKLNHISTAFVPLDWEDVAAASSPTKSIPKSLQGKSLDLIMASDVTYNPATSPSLAKTLSALSRSSLAFSESEPLVLVAMKVRHEDEDVFWGEMEQARFIVVQSTGIWCPDFEFEEAVEECEGEWVQVYLFRRLSDGG
ncbi:MAG: hypothetical protein Q9159_004409 [Coniocarpon cinnabarinum]